MRPSAPRGGRGHVQAWLAEVPQVVRGWELEPVSVELAVPGEHNRSNAATALAALELAGVARPDAEPVLARFRGAGRRRARRRAQQCPVVDDYAHHPSEIDATLAPHGSAPTGACSFSSSRTSTRVRATWPSWSSALRRRRRGVTEIYARAAALAGVGESSSSTRSVPASGRAGRRRSRTAPGSSRAGPTGRSRPYGRRGGRRRAGPLVLELCEGGGGRAASRLTTIGTGGPAAAFARPSSLEELRRALPWADERGLPVAVVGLGSNLLAADAGVDALVPQAHG